MRPVGFLSDAMGPCITICPRFMTTTASQTDSTSGITCDDRIRLMCLLCAMSRTSASISSRPFGSMPLVGSSRSSRSGSWTSACASLIRCFMPRGVRLHVSVPRLSKARRSTEPHARAASHRRPAVPRARRNRQRTTPPSCLECARRFPACSRRARESRAAWPPHPDRARSIRPLSGLRSPSSAFSIVLLPAPFGPRRPTAPAGNRRRHIRERPLSRRSGRRRVREPQRRVGSDINELYETDFTPPFRDSATSWRLDRPRTSARSRMNPMTLAMCSSSGRPNLFGALPQIVAAHAFCKRLVLHPLHHRRRLQISHAFRRPHQRGGRHEAGHLVAGEQYVLEHRFPWRIRVLAMRKNRANRRGRGSRDRAESRRP